MGTGEELVSPLFILWSVVKLDALLYNSLGIWSIMGGLVFKEDGCSLTAAWLVSKPCYKSSGRPACCGDSGLTHGRGPPEGRDTENNEALSLLGFTIYSHEESYKHLSRKRFITDVKDHLSWRETHDIWADLYPWGKLQDRKLTKGIGLGPDTSG